MYTNMDRPGFMAGWQGRPRAERGNMSIIILHVLGDKPMHGYEIIRTLEEKSRGIWRPSPGSVYPTLQLLEEQGLILGEDQQGKKIYSITPKGEEARDKKTGFTNPWETKGKSSHPFHCTMGNIRRIMLSSRLIISNGSETQIEEAHQILLKASEELESIAGQFKEDK